MKEQLTKKSFKNPDFVYSGPTWKSLPKWAPPLTKKKYLSQPNLQHITTSVFWLHSHDYIFSAVQLQLYSWVFEVVILLIYEAN